jgi:polysaccharide biosynthesis/export protein
MNGFRIATLWLLLSSLIWAQNYPKKEAINYDQLLRNHPLSVPIDNNLYRSPYLPQDSIERITQSVDSNRAQTTNGDTLRMFGYNLFERGGTTLEIPPNLAVPDDYKLGPGDNISVFLWGRVEQEYSLAVDRQGAVFIPKVGEVPLWGVTLPQAERRIREKLATVFSDFQLSISLGKLKSIQVFVFGEVRYPGSYTVNSFSTMFSALYQAGGPTERGSLRRIKLIRNGTETAVVDLYQFLLFGKNVAGVALQSGDVIFADVVGKRVKVTGAVKRPAIYEIAGHETISDILSLAGGTTPSAYLEKVRIDRIADNDAYKVIDLNLTDSTTSSKSFAVDDGDEVFVESIYSLKQNVIYLEGGFRHPGIYQYREGLTMADLFKEGCDLEEKAYRGRIDILRNDTGYDTSLMSVNPEDLIAGKANMALRPGDRLIAFSREDVVPQRQVAIYGMVNKPGDYSFYDGMRVSDLVFHAGSLKQSAYALRVELARLKDDGSKELIYASLEDPQQDIPLRDRDKIFIRQIPGWEEKDMVTIEGAVSFPGRYVITDKMNTLYSLVDRAGGLTDEAFPTGTVFTRATIVADLKRRGVDELINRSIEKNVEDSGTVKIDSTGMLRANSMSNRIVVYVEELLREHGGKYDIKLADGDHIYIPRKPAGIQVLGAVPSISTISYQQGENVKYYIKKAGGFLQNADKKNLQLIRADGTIASGRSAAARTVKLGDAIFVPTRVDKEHDWLKVLTSSLTVLTSVATTALLISKL